jgi:hypothetical protein
VNAGIALPPSVEPRRAAEQSRRLLESDVRPWRVLHLCCGVSEIAPVLEVQRTAGMRPLAFTQSGPAEPSTWLAGSPPASSASLLSAWREVRTWRMAAVRANAPLVYDIHRFVEQAAGALGEIAEHCWLERSFRTAEQFVLARAAAVIVHSAPAYRGALDRGCASGSVFIFPELLQTPRPELEPAWLRNLAKRYDAVYGNVLSRGRAGRGPLLPPGCQPLAACL